jgi:hypothetical protein
MLLPRRSRRNDSQMIFRIQNCHSLLISMARPKRFELLTPRFVVLVTLQSLLSVIFFETRYDDLVNFLESTAVKTDLHDTRIRRLTSMSALPPCVDGPELARTYFTFAALVGAPMCSACLRGSHDRWP